MVGPVAAAARLRRATPSAERRPGGGAGRTSGALGGVVPSGRGRAGGVGLGVRVESVGPPRPRRRRAVDHHRRRDRHGRGRPGRTPAARRRPGRCARAVAQAEFDVLPELLQLILEPALGVLELLDASVRLPQLLLEPVDPEDAAPPPGPPPAARRERRDGGAACAVCGAGGGRSRNPARRRAWRRRADGRTDRGERDDRGAGVARASHRSRRGQLPGAPFSTVTARRFCDQHEMSSHTATGRSLP